MFLVLFAAVIMISPSQKNQHDLSLDGPNVQVEESQDLDN